ncbi:tetratricopeptide repeat protein [Psychroserpens mesophilus]|uniref:CHAT domain-containing protein n=1 Tax=Psychroserpens mesophilus TaxID=325473 RepID=UPI003D65082E
MTKSFCIQFYCLCFLFVTFVQAQDDAYDSWQISYSEGIKAFESKDFENAKTAFINAITISDQFSEVNKAEKGNTAFYLGQTFFALKINAQTISLIEHAIEVSEDTTSLDYVEKAKFLGNVYDIESQYSKALQHYKGALQALKINNQTQTLVYANGLSRVGSIYRIEGNYDKAEKTIIESLRIIDHVESKTHLDYGTTLSSLSIVYKKKGQYKQAVSSAREGLDIIKNVTGVKSSEYASARTNLAQIYTETGEYDKAIDMQKEALALYDSIGKKSINYAGALIALSNLYHEVGEYQKEIPILNEIQGILSETHSAQATIHNNLGQAYDRMGDYEKALFFTQIGISKTTSTHSSYGTRLQNLAFIYVKLGEMQKALETYALSKSAIEEKYGTSHPLYGRLVNNIGKLHYTLGNFPEAKTYFKEALDNFLNNFDENHPKYGYYLNDYARTLLILGQSNEALTLMKNNLRLAEDNSRRDTEAYYNRQYNLAIAYNSLGRYEEALPLLLNSTENLKLKLGNDHPDYGKMLKSLSDTHVGLGNYDEAFRLMEITNEVTIKQLDKIFKFRSEIEKKAFLKIVTKNFDDMQSVPISAGDEMDSWNALNLNNQLMLKGLLLNNSKDVLSQLQTLNDTDIQQKIDNYNILKRRLTKVLSQSLLEREIDTDSLKAVINTEEAQLVKLYSSHFSNQLDLTKDWKSSQKQLKKDEIAIEFSNFKYTNKNKLTDSIMYVAYIYKRHWKFPKMIPLFEQNKLESILKSSNPNQLYTSQYLYDLIWSPIENYTKDHNTIYFSPSGLLNQIQFAAIAKTNDFSIGQVYNLVQLSSTAILASKPTEPATDSALFIGGIDYEYVEATSKTNLNSDYAYLDTEVLRNTKATRSRGETWTYLEGTLAEINNLQSIFNRYQKDYLVLSGNEATETNLKRLSGNSPHVIHIATHGFFYENLETNHANQFSLSTEDQYRLAEDPLLRSGLILAGANYAWKNGSNPNEIDDGILSAMEISHIDLSQTDIVVLSACETGLGDIDGSEGVYGLQRAFKMAGVDIIVMSLWQVPDAETAEFMNLFYENWVKDKQVRKAFTVAQRTMQEKYNDEPLKWAAFVLFE